MVSNMFVYVINVVKNKDFVYFDTFVCLEMFSLDANSQNNP